MCLLLVPGHLNMAQAVCTGWPARHLAHTWRTPHGTPHRSATAALLTRSASLAALVPQPKVCMSKSNITIWNRDTPFLAMPRSSSCHKVLGSASSMSCPWCRQCPQRSSHHSPQHLYLHPCRPAPSTSRPCSSSISSTGTPRRPGLDGWMVPQACCSIQQLRGRAQRRHHSCGEKHHCRLCLSPSPHHCLQTCSLQSALTAKTGLGCCLVRPAMTMLQLHA